MFYTITQASASKNQIQSDTIPVHDVRSINNMFPKIDNLENFPPNVLKQIFQRIDDNDLLSLAENSSRFEMISKIVLSARYTHEYYHVDAIKFNSEMFEIFFEVFGDEIKAFQVDGIQNESDEDYCWIASLLNRTSKLEKLQLCLRIINESHENLLNRHGSNIVHLILQSSSGFTHKGITLSEFRNLKKLELVDSPSISLELLQEVVHNNPGLESLYIGDRSENFHGKEIVRTYPFGELMALIAAAHMTGLKEFSYVPFWYRTIDTTKFSNVIEYHWRQSADHIVDTFIDSLKYLESLALSSDINPFIDWNELLPRLASQCKHIKHLKLYQFYPYDDQFMAIKSFERLDSLLLASHDFEYVDWNAIIDCLPILNHLHIKMLDNRQRNWSFVLMLLEKSPYLEKLTISCNFSGFDFEFLSTVQCFPDFKNCMQTQCNNVVIEIKCCEKMIGRITKNEVIWRNKLTHWVGYDPSQNKSNIHLLNLAINQSTQNAYSFKNQKGINNPPPFELILDYLDLNSLESLSKTNQKISQLIENYVKKCSLEHRWFTVTNEFFTPYNTDYKHLNKFVKHVENLKVNIVQHKIYNLQGIIKTFDNLHKLHIFAYNVAAVAYIVVPQVRHLIVHTEYVHEFRDLYKLAFKCPDLETLEFKQKHSFDLLTRITTDGLGFPKLKKIIFNCLSNQELLQFQEIFKNTDTER